MRTELLAPVGSKDAFYAAIYNGANAVYLGGKAFGARAYADNFTNEEIAEMIAFAHLLDVKVYVTVNTVVYDDEFSQLTEFLDFLYLHDCDAVIIQDIGVATFISHRYPNFALHASTQMNIHSIEQVKALKLLGFSRVVLAREVSLKEIVLIKEAVDIELEVFVHGALCVSCSGNCYMSSIIGKRSGNRGRCAQPCRLEYEFNKKTKYFISPKDLNTLEYVDELLDALIDSLKIEGRMKRPEYVAQVVSSYQKAILGYYDKKEWNVKAEQDALKTIFNRGFTKGWLFDEKNVEFINEQFSNHGGIEIGEVISSTQDWIDISLTHPLHYQDAIRIVGDYEDGIVVNQMYQNHQMIKSANAGDVVTLKPHISGLMGAKVLLTTDQRQIEVLRQSYQTLKPMIAIQASLLVEDQYLVLRLVCRDKVVEVKSGKKVEIANNDQMTKRIIEQLHKTANTLFYFSNIEVLFSQGVFLPIKDINALRRNGLEKLSLVLAKKHTNRMIQDVPFEELNEINLTKGLVAKVRTKEQLEVVVQYDFTNIYVTDEQLMKYETKYPNHKLIHCLPRIHKENKHQGTVVSSDLGTIANNHTSIYLPVTNAYSLYRLFSQKAKRVGISLELSFDQIKQMLDRFQTLFHKQPNVEMMVYGRYELMMMKYCLVKNNGGCALCQSKTDNQLIDRRGFSFPIFQDSQCYVKILNSKKLHLGDYINLLYESGVTNLLLDFTTEDAQETQSVCEIYCNNQKQNNLFDVTYGHFKEGVL